MKYFLFPLLLVACSACAHVQASRPLLWKVSDADNHVYLLGSFHALKASDYPVAPAVDAAFDDAEKLAFEISPEEMRSPELTQKMLAAGTLPEDQTLEQVVSGDNWRQLRKYTEQRGISMQGFQRFEPWLVSLLIGLSEMTREGYDPGQGLDQVLMARAERAGKPSAGLETAGSQIAALDGMSRSEQEQSLAESLEQAENFKKQIGQLHAQWRAGDDKALLGNMVTEFQREYPALYQRINVARNQAWLPKIQRMLDGETHSDTLIVVGSLHLLGEDGLVAQLKKKGYTVERL